MSLQKKRTVRKEEANPNQNGRRKDDDALRPVPDNEVELEEIERFMSRKEKAFRRLAS